MVRKFWTRREIRQECPLSPDLFNLMMTDLEDYLRKGGWEIKINREKIYSLAYTDDVLLAEEEEEMRAMMKELQKYLREKGLELNVSKSKILRFKKGRNREKVKE